MKGTYDKPGIIPLAIQHIFKYIENVCCSLDAASSVPTYFFTFFFQTPDREFLLRVSYLEIYKEVITDLLMPGNTNLAVHEDIKVRGRASLSIFLKRILFPPVLILLAF
jgi:centromeric protein E